MSKNATIAVEARERAGKGSARAARRSGKVPAVIYGDKKEPILVTIARNELVKAMNRGGFMNTLFQVTVPGGKQERVIPRDLQLHPVSDEPLHVDFLRLGEGSVIVFEVPVHFINEETSVGLKRGGIINVVRHHIEVKCRARDLPDFFEINLGDKDIGDSIHASELVLPEGVKLVITDRDFTIATIAAPKVEVVESDEDEDAASDKSDASDQSEDEAED